ncbi:hypothetical protein [Anaerorhabdus sp.]|uniref:hypothetical protein n=3 Tax=Anaerorhabdus sp. TaxID=1872524 RepID=UPI002FC63DA4
MRNKKIYPIGYLLKILGISYTELASALFIDRTVVNKWALGKRTFNTHSSRYEEVVKYLIDANSKNNELGVFFEHIYPNVPKDEKFLEECIKLFIERPDLIAETEGTILKSTDNVFHCTALVYRTVFGRFAAVTNLLEKCLLSTTKKSIFMYDNDDFLWLLDDYYYHYFKDKMIEVLEKKHLVMFIMDENFLKTNSKLTELLDFFYSYDNFEKYYFRSNRNPKCMNSYYIVKDEKVVLGNKLTDGNLYTITLIDPFSIESWYENVKSHLQYCSINKKLKTEKERSELIDIVCQIINSSIESTYNYSVGLSFVTMGEELFTETLQKNKVFGEKKNMLMKLYRTRIESFNNMVSLRYLFRQISYLEDIKQQLQFEEFKLKELSLLAGKDIILSKDQIQQHLLDTIQLLRSNKGFSLGLLREANLQYRIDFNLMCTKNQYSVVFSKFIRFTREYEVVNDTVNLMETEWNDEIPFEYKDNLKVADILESLLDKEN